MRPLQAERRKTGRQRRSRRQPLRDATHTVEALRLVGHGLSSHDHVGGDAVAELARIAAERLQVVEDRWKKVLEARTGKRS
jgi:hypothetical protein